MRAFVWSLLSCILTGQLLPASVQSKIPGTAAPDAAGADRHQQQVAPPESVQTLLQQSVAKLYSAPEEVIAISHQAAHLAVQNGNAAACAAAIAQRSCARLLTEGPVPAQSDFLAAMAVAPRDPDRVSHAYLLHALCLRARLMRSASVVSCTEGLRKDLKSLGESIPNETRLHLWSEVLWTEISRVDPEYKRRRRADFSEAALMQPEEGQLSQQWFLQLLQKRSSFSDADDGETMRETIRQSLASPEYHALAPLWKLAATECLLSLDAMTHEKAMTKELQATLADLAFSTPYIPVRAIYATSSPRVEHLQFIGDLFIGRQVDLPMITDPDALLNMSQMLTAGTLRSTSIPEGEIAKRIASQANRLLGYDRAASALIASKTSLDLDKLEEAQVEQSERLREVLVDGNTHAWWSDFWMAVAGAVVVSLFVLMLIDHRALRNVNDQLSKAMQRAEQQRSEQERMELRIAQTERLESLGTLAGGVAHDFNNLLVGVLGNADLLKQIVPSDPHIDEYIEGIIRSAETAAELSRKMLVYAGKEPSRKCVVDLNQVIGRMLPLLRSGLSCRHGIEFLPSNVACMTEADTGQLEQILMNLVSNSAQAMHDTHGRVTLSTGEMMIENPAELSRLQMFGNRTSGGRFVWFEVTDSGDGISEADMSRLFQPFFTTRSRTQGHGFGLSVVYGHVNRHDGLIRVSSRRGEGTTFRILLPKTDCTVSTDTDFVDRGDSNIIVPASSGRIVAVDDQQTVLDVVQRACEASGMRVSVFRTATEALEFIADTDDIDCLLLDMMMPEFDGHSMLEELYQRGIHIPVIVMSGYSQTNAEDYSMFPNVRMTMQKPFRKSQLIRAIQNIASQGPVTGTARPSVALTDEQDS